MARGSATAEGRAGSGPGGAPETLADDAAACIARGGSWRSELPGGGRAHLDRALPFLAVYRSPAGRSDAGVEHLVDALAAYVVAPGGPPFQEGVDALVRAVADAVRERLGGFLLVEVWTEVIAGGDDGSEAGAGREHPAAARLRVLAEGGSPPVGAHALEEAVAAMRLRADNGGDLGVAPAPGEVTLELRERVAPPGLPPLAPGHVQDGSCVRLGLEVSPFFRDRATGVPYPRIVSVLRRELARAVERASFVFAQERTSLDAPHPAALGRREVDRDVRRVDARLGEIYGRFDPLLQVTPVNAGEAWERFRASGCDRGPELRYRPLPFDPEETKRLLFSVPIERVEDPLLNQIFREKQEELDLQISLVRGLATDGFRWAAYQLHGTVDEDLVELAERVLERVPAASTDEEEPSAGYVDADAFARRARRELDHYRVQADDFPGTLEIRDDVAAGLMVSKGVLMIGRGLRAPERRVDALLHHEVGTHVVTYANGVGQPLRLFAAGLAGYEGLQEGLAVLAEYLGGGLTAQRVRVLAGRVLAVRSVVDGAGFMDTWRLLTHGHGFQPRTAFVASLRVHRGGGFTKDAVYLRGLRDLLAYLCEGGSLDRLLVGKVGLQHAGAVQELMLRGVLRIPRVRPRYLTEPGAAERLEACRSRGVLDLLDDLAA